jgi:hypothetical protein
VAILELRLAAGDTSFSNCRQHSKAIIGFDSVFLARLGDRDDVYVIIICDSETFSYSKANSEGCATSVQEIIYK